MCERILGSFWMWYQSISHVLYLSFITRCCILSTAVVDVYVPSQRCTDEVAHHRRTFVIRREFAASYLEAGVIRTDDRPPGLGHGTMRCLMLLLRMALKEVSSCILLMVRR
jgi:hypothetical protein